MTAREGGRQVSRPSEVTAVPCTVVCDKCGWKADVPNGLEYHNAPCPECGNAPILNDDEASSLRALGIMFALGLATPTEDAPGPNRLSIHAIGNELRIRDRSES